MVSYGSCQTRTLRIVFAGNEKAGYDIVFESQQAGIWKQSATFPKGQVWMVYSDWRDSLYADPHPVRAQKVEALGDGRVKVSAVANIAGQKWAFTDIYSVKHGMVQVDRSFNHLDAGSQSKITLESRIRLPLGTDQRFLMPGVLYNNNPNATLTGTKIPTKPGGLGLYEEHRLPVPMVNIESLVDGRRTFGSIVTKPSKISQGHKGNDHWWSIGLEYGEGYVDLLSISGPVATNGKKSQVYGHRNGFNSYNDAYLDIQGPAIFEKTLYVDLGAGIKTGYSFRETLWKAFDIFRPTETPNVPFSEAMSLVAGYARSRFEKWPGGAAGYPFFIGDDLIMYGWVGGNLGIAYGMLEYAEKRGDTTSLAQAMETIRFFVKNSGTGVDGLYYGDYHSDKRGWSPAGFYGSAAPGISSRQFGENFEHLASLVELGRRMKLPEAEEWFTMLKKAGDFLLSSQRHQGMFPRAWTLQGMALGLTADGDLLPRDISAAGAQCVCLLSRLGNLTGDTKYSDAASTAMDAYWHEFGETLATPPWGATLDAGGEDKEAGWGMMRAALETYIATREPRFLQMAKDAADWTLTWMYFHDVGLKPESGLLYKYLHTVGWTFISTQNQEIDVWGYFMAPDFYHLGLVSGDDRYKQIGRVLFQAATQTISRPGAMFGSYMGEQAEHYNHSNCTYVEGGPELWRGSQHAMGISWAFAASLYGGSRLTELAPLEFSLGSGPATNNSLRH